MSHDVFADLFRNGVGQENATCDGYKLIYCNHSRKELCWSFLACALDNICSVACKISFSNVFSTIIGIHAAIASQQCSLISTKHFVYMTSSVKITSLQCEGSIPVPAGKITRCHVFTWHVSVRRIIWQQ